MLIQPVQRKRLQKQKAAPRIKAEGVRPMRLHVAPRLRRNPDASDASNTRWRAVTAVYSAPGRHHIIYDRDFTGRDYRLPRLAGLGPARGRLPNHSGGDALPWGEPGCRDIVDYRAAGTPVRPDVRPETDGLPKLGGRIGHYLAIPAHLAAGCSRTRSAGRH